MTKLQSRKIVALLASSCLMSCVCAEAGGGIIDWAQRVRSAMPNYNARNRQLTMAMRGAVPVGDRRSTPEETNAFFHSLGKEVGDVGRVVAGGFNHLVTGGAGRAGPPRDPRSAPAAPASLTPDYTAPESSYQEPLPTVPPVNTGYVNPLDTATKPPLHEKIVKDIGNVFGAVFNPKTGDTANYQAPDPNYSEPSPSAGYDAPETGYTPGTGVPLQGARVKKQINLGAGQSSFLKVPGKPPLPEKFRQDVRSAVNGVIGMVGLGGQQTGIGKQQDVAVGPTEPPMLKTMYQAINQVSKFYLDHYKNMLLTTKKMVSPIMATARNLMPDFPTSKAKSQQVLLPKVQSYFDPEQGVEYWYDPTEGQWYYHYPETVAKKAIEPSTQVEVVTNTQGKPEWAIVGDQAVAASSTAVDQSLNEILDAEASELSQAKSVQDAVQEEKKLLQLLTAVDELEKEAEEEEAAAKEDSKDEE